jgi:predicted transcriptional regulator
MNLKAALASKIHRDIIIFFNENPTAVDTPRGVATWVHQERTVVKKALEDLVSLNILDACRATSTTGYSYTTDKKTIARIAKLLKRRKT